VGHAGGNWRKKEGGTRRRGIPKEKFRKRKTGTQRGKDLKCPRKNDQRRKGNPVRRQRNYTGTGKAQKWNDPSHTANQKEKAGD